MEVEAGISASRKGSSVSVRFELCTEVVTGFSNVRYVIVKETGYQRKSQVGENVVGMQ